MSGRNHRWVDADGDSLTSGVRSGERRWTRKRVLQQRRRRAWGRRAATRPERRRRSRDSCACGDAACAGNGHGRSCAADCINEIRCARRWPIRCQSSPGAPPKPLVC
jgi:hypothetical protein